MAAQWSQHTCCPRFNMRFSNFSVYELTPHSSCLFGVFCFRTNVFILLSTKWIILHSEIAALIKVMARLGHMKRSTNMAFRVLSK
ncbi:hypothetical protein PHET_02399 [Paragonimus heterotremus]|uniref:Uncharacterized protein n=1 Tax=Paragonimus heterotremus TaxID=100268 RepID=A0A8J4TJ88_9TREM|nr:hypothetical protein PHET_02399 [Paragonimus heterotremus]